MMIAAYAVALIGPALTLMGTRRSRPELRRRFRGIACLVYLEHKEPGPRLEAALGATCVPNATRDKNLRD